MFVAFAIVGASTDVLADSGDVQLSIKYASTPKVDIAERYGKQWGEPIRHFVEDYSLISPASGRTVLTVMAVRLDYAYKEGLFEKMPDLPIPNPIILNTKGDKIGELPEGFPFDPPGQLVVTFSNWRDDFPTVVRFYEQGKSAIGPHPLPARLVYNEKTQRYVEHQQSAQTKPIGALPVSVASKAGRPF